MLIQRWNKTAKEQRPQIELAILANKVTVLCKKDNIAEEDTKQEAIFNAEFKAFWKRWESYNFCFKFLIEIRWLQDQY